MPPGKPQGDHGLQRSPHATKIFKDRCIRIKHNKTRRGGVQFASKGLDKHLLSGFCLNKCDLINISKNLPACPLRIWLCIRVTKITARFPTMPAAAVRLKPRVYRLPRIRDFFSRPRFPKYRRKPVLPLVTGIS
jgi:hypothetical protein